MAKLNSGLKRIIVEDFAAKDRELVSKLAFSVNPFFNDIVNALNNNLTFKDNLNASVVSVDIKTPITNTTVKTNLKGPCTGIIPIAVADLSNNPSNLSGAPFVEFINSDIGQITITNITGLSTNKRYSIRLILLGE